MTMVTNDKAPRYNAEGYIDPTAHQAMQKMDVEDAQVSRLIHILKEIIDQAGFDLLARIEIRDRRTGREYR